ncbi:acetylornithine aminotransferase [Salsuginibacillus halophilus]|uniref:Acetylornithine aminotransferase n=1 Tax=Salsuginibacillus halophilus TaxID=517424 RepID=A0A2P8HXH9_9BACI|nr:acetylornithine transaminase [Salsuginibacillus halophilus]PSL50939.1 acetylornithine aminotransferase [Salsuginibacillus halophilus]
MTEQTTAEYIFPTYKRWPITFQAAAGSTIEDTDGKVYTDLMSGIGTVNFGHTHPRITAAVKAQLEQGWHASNFFHYDSQKQAARTLAELSGLNAAFFANSGAEANEGAIKLARKATGKTTIVTFHQSFHGRTTGSMAATGQPAVHSGFGPVLEGFTYVPFNDITAVKEAVDQNTAAVMLEIVQGEGGVKLGDAEFYKAVEQVAKEHGALVIVDEVQTGIGRTGRTFAFEHYGMRPSIVTSAKALGNGFPVGAVLAEASLVDAFGPGTHGSTFGGNPLAMSAVNAVLNELTEEQLAEVSRRGEAVQKKLNEALHNNPFVHEVRGLGMMIGIECIGPVTDIMTKLRSDGVLVLNAGPNVLRLLPPLNIPDPLLDEATDQLIHILQAYAEEYA